MFYDEKLYSSVGNKHMGRNHVRVRLQIKGSNDPAAISPESARRRDHSPVSYSFHTSARHSPADSLDTSDIPCVGLYNLKYGLVET